MSFQPGVTAASEEYLEWIYRLSKEKQAVSPLDLARRLKVSPASVTAMLKRLTAANLIAYQTHQGITLTQDGQKVAARMVRRHGLLERLLTDILGLPWEKADETACQLEHYLTEEVEDRLAAVLGNPTTCPHGQFIDLEDADYTHPLLDLASGAEASVARITDEDPEFLSYLASLGIRPGARIQLTQRSPFDGPITINVSGATHAIGRETAEKVRVELLPQN